MRLPARAIVAARDSALVIAAHSVAATGSSVVATAGSAVIATVASVTRPVVLAAAVVTLLSLPASAFGQRLFVGLEGSAPPTKSSDLSGFPSVTWATHASVDVSGAAATPDGTLYICSGAFTTELFEFPLSGTPVHLSTLGVDIHGMGYGNGTLYGYSNFTSPRGIYTLVPETGAAQLLVDLDASGFRFFALDFNPIDGLLYGYTEYGSPTGLYSIDPETGVTTFLAAPIPASNSSARALAVGDGVVYLAATRGDDGVPLYAWDISTAGPWVEFNNPYPEYHSTGGAAWIPDPTTSVEPSWESGALMPRIDGVFPSPVRGSARVSWSTPTGASVALDLVDVNGRRVVSLVDGGVQAGAHITNWDGRGEDGRLLPSGMYFLRLAGTEGETTRPVLVVR
ncbi:MAG: T9SS type A sorting domain-containing protein [Candidatus Eisenbacteria bacterium]|nr:T9SS type A sorting domain-containing protein [Candidatus Eisenbacteria bacterium]